MRYYIKMAQLTRNEKFLPKNLATVLRCLKRGVATARELTDKNPLKLKHKNNRIAYSRLLKKLHDIGLVDRERNLEQPVCESGYCYIYTVKKLEPVKLKANQCLKF